MKELCKINSSYYEENISDILKTIKKPKYICTKCVRAAKKKSHLCKPEKINS